MVFATEPDQATLEKTADRAFAEPGDLADYAITLINDSPLTTTFTISDPIPANASYVPGQCQRRLILRRWNGGAYWHSPIVGRENEFGFRSRLGRMDPSHCRIMLIQ